MKNKKRIRNHTIGAVGYNYCVMRLDDDGIMCRFHKNKPEIHADEFLFRCRQKGETRLPSAFMAEYGIPDLSEQTVEIEQWSKAYFKILAPRLTYKCQAFAVDTDVPEPTAELLQKAEKTDIVKQSIRKGLSDLKRTLLCKGSKSSCFKVTYVTGDRTYCVVSKATKEDIARYPDFDAVQDMYNRHLGNFAGSRLTYICKIRQIGYVDRIIVPGNGYDRLAKEDGNVYLFMPAEVTVTNTIAEPALEIPKKEATKYSRHEEIMELLKKVRELQIAVDRLG